MAERRSKLYTVGYEGTTIDDFTSFLQRKKITLLADVRKNPLSRRKGFSKNKLAAALAEKGIDYLHLPTLGVPTEWRKSAKAGEITRRKMFADYKKKILPRAADEIGRLRRLLKEERLTLLCVEADAADCHRRFLADEIVRQEGGHVDVIDLTVHSERAANWLSTSRQ